jgi:DNA-binding MarR family transcriptional regulator
MQIGYAQALLENPNASITDIRDTLRLSRATLYRHLEEAAGK